MQLKGADRIADTVRRCMVMKAGQAEATMTTNFFNPVTTQTWTNGRHQVRCVKVIQETQDVRTFCFMA